MTRDLSEICKNCIIRAECPRRHRDTVGTLYYCPERVGESMRKYMLNGPERVGTRALTVNVS